MIRSNNLGSALNYAGTPAMEETIVRELLIAAALHDVNTLRHLIEIEGLPADATYAQKPTALCYALLKPHHPMMEYLVGKGADIMYADGLGMTPLHYAALGGCEYCISYLINLGAPINRPNNSGKTPLALTENKPHLVDCREFLQRVGGAYEQSSSVVRKLH